jgi:hypothetical protein
VARPVSIRRAKACCSRRDTPEAAITYMALLWFPVHGNV